MNDKEAVDSGPSQVSDLHREAERRLRERKAMLAEDTAEVDSRALVHELQVHQIELEIQNEELRFAQGALQEVSEKYHDLFDFAPIGYFRLDAEGRILEVNLAGAALLGMERSIVLKRRFCQHVAPQSVARFTEFFNDVLRSDDRQTCEVELLRGDQPAHALLEGICARGGEAIRSILVTVTDVTDRQRIEDAKMFLLQAGSKGSGEEFFQALAKYLAQSLGMDYVCIDRLLGDELLAHTLAVYNDGMFDENVTYALKDTPCGEVVGKSICCFPKNVSQLFPKDLALQKLKAESYVGTTLWSFDGKPIGLIAVIGRKPLANPFFAESILTLAAVRAASEMERNQAENALQQLNVELERRVAEQTAEIQETYEAVKAERQRLYDLLEALPACVVLLSVDYRVRFANCFFRERFGDPRGQCCFTHLFQRTVTCENCESCKVLETGEPHDWEWTGPDGRHYEMHDLPFVDVDGSAFILKLGIDNTDRTNAQHALEASEARYRSFVTASTLMTWTTDAEGLIADDLPSWRAFTGQSVEQIRGWGWIDALHPDDRERTAAAWSQAVAAGSIYTIEYRLRRHDGEYRWLSVRGVPVFSDGAIREWVGACTDITEQRRANAVILQMKTELAHLDRTARLGELTSSLAHELNQPLTAILSNAQAARRLLAADAPDLDAFREIVDDVIRDDKRAGGIIHRLRRMLQKEQPEPERFDVNNAVREVVQLLHGEIVGNNAAISMDLAPALPAVWAERIEIQQVIVNLFLNSLHAVKDLPRDRRKILIRSRPDEDAVVIAVQDRGCGIQSPDINKIFEPFFTTKPAGLGMGLAICRRMIESHGGRIWAANNEDAGATVAFSVPSHRVSQEPSDG